MTAVATDELATNVRLVADNVSHFSVVDTVT